MRSHLSSENKLALGLLLLVVIVIGAALDSYSMGTVLHLKRQDMEEELLTTCSPPRFTGQATFLNHPKGTAKYLFDGICTSPQRPGAQIQYQLEASWSPSETDPKKPNASESVTITGYEPFISNRSPNGRVFMYWTGRCQADPWLQPDIANCRYVGISIPNDLRTAIPEFQSLNFPKTESIIGPADRQRLQAQYLGLNPKLRPPTAQYRVDPPVLGAPRPGVAPMMIAPPELISPVAGNVVTQGTILVKILRSLGGRAEVEFTWLDQPPLPPGVVLETKNWLVTMDQLAVGAVAPPQMTDKPGRWQVRVRKILDYNARWSQAVPFQVVLVPGQQLIEPPRTQKGMRKIPSAPGMMLNPQLGEASELNPQPLPPRTIPGVVVQPPGQDAALNPQPLLPKALSPDVLVPGIIMRRGVDEKTPPSKEEKARRKDESPAAATPAR